MKSLLRISFLLPAVFLTAVPGCGSGSSESNDTETNSEPSTTDTADSDSKDSETTDSDSKDSETADSDSKDSETTGSKDSDSKDSETTGSKDSDSKDSDSEPNDAGVDSDSETASLWGWISAIEWNDACDQWDMITDWTGGVRAYFAESVSYPRSLPHHLDFISETASEGNCKLYDAGLLANCEKGKDDCFECLDSYYECWNNCGPDQEPQASDTVTEGVCTDLPKHWNLGTITLSGLKESITLHPDEYDRYFTAAKLTDQNDLFDDGDVLTATAEGGAFSPLTFTTKGTAPLEVASTMVDLSPDSPAIVRWTPADDDSRVQIVLMSGSHDPNPLAAAVICDVPDSDGKVEIPTSLINGFAAEICPAAQAKCSRITRYNRDVQTIGGKNIEFFVGSARKLLLRGYDLNF